MCLFEHLEFLAKTKFLFAKLDRELELLAGDRFLHPSHDSADLVLDPPQGRGRRDLAQFDPGARLVENVDGLVRKGAVGDIAACESGRGLDGGISELNPVEFLVAALHSLEDGDCLLFAGLTNRKRPGIGGITHGPFRRICGTPAPSWHRYR